MESVPHLRRPEGSQVGTVTWAEIESGVERIAHQARDLAFTTILPVMRGGIAPALLLSHLLEVRSIAPFQCVKTRSESPLDYGELKILLRPPLATGERVLVVEDIIHQGVSVHSAVEYTRAVGARAVAVAVMVVNGAFDAAAAADAWRLPLLTAFTCEPEMWVRFPWERPIAGERPAQIMAPACGLST